MRATSVQIPADRDFFFNLQNLGSLTAGPNLARDVVCLGIMLTNYKFCCCCDHVARSLLTLRPCLRKTFFFTFYILGTQAKHLHHLKNYPYIDFNTSLQLRLNIISKPINLEFLKLFLR